MSKNEMLTKKRNRNNLKEILPAAAVRKPLPRRPFRDQTKQGNKGKNFYQT